MPEFSNDELAKLREVLRRLETEHKTRPKRTYDEELKESGFGVFTKEGQLVLERIRNRYEGDFRKFFVDLNNKYMSTKKATAEIKRVSDVLARINSLTIHVNKLIGSVDFKNAPEDVTILKRMIKDLDSEFSFFINTENITKTLAENITETERTTGVNLEDLKYAQGIFGRKVQEVTKPSRILMPGIGPAMGGGIKNIGEALLYSTLTPFAPIFGALKYLGRSAGERERRRETFGETDFAMAGANVSPRTLPPMRETLGGYETEEAVARRGWRSERTGGSLGTSTIGIQEGMFMFFNTRAYQARWTKELLEAVGGKGPEKGPGEGRGSFLDKIGETFGKMIGPVLGPVFSALGKTLAVAAAGAFGWWLGRWIGEHLKWGGKTLDEHLQGFFQKYLFGGSESDQLRRQAKATKDPVQRRALELQAENPQLNSVEALRQAEDEWKNRPSPVGMGMEFRISDKASRDIMKSDMSRDWETKKAARLSEQAVQGQETSVPREAIQDPATGMYVAYSSKDNRKFFGITPEEAMGKRDKAEASVGKASLSKITEMEPSATQIQWATPKIPIDTALTQAQRDQTGEIKQLATQVGELATNIKETNTTKTGKGPSGYDANNTRNPLLSSLDAGNISPD